MLTFMASTLHAAPDAQLNRKLEEAVAKMREAEAASKKSHFAGEITNAGRQLSALTQGIDPSSVDDKTISNIISLLDIGDHYVTYWTTAALKNFGSRINAQLTMKLKKTVASAREVTSLNEQRKAAEEVSTLTCFINPALVDDKTIADVISLLDIPDRSVQIFVTVALGPFGSRAKAAAPKLLVLLREDECIQWNLTASTGVPWSVRLRPMLEQMGIEPPPFPLRENCRAQANTVLEEAAAQVRRAKSAEERFAAAKMLVWLMYGVDFDSIDDKTLLDILSLIDFSEFPAGISPKDILGYLGPLGHRAKAAAPELLALLREDDCKVIAKGEGYNGLTFGRIIRPMLERIGITPPPISSLEDCQKPQ